MYNIKKLNSLLLVCILLLVFVLSSCATVARLTIVGKWQSDNNGFIEFYNSGDVIQSTVLGINTSGTYKIIDNDKLEIDYKGLGSILGPQIMEYKLSINELSITYPLLGTTVYRKR